MMPRLDLAGVVGLAMTLLALPAAAAPSRAELEERIQRLEAAAQRDDSRALLDLSRQVDTLSAELRTLRGQVEELRQQVARQAAGQRSQYLDLDGRLAELERRAQLSATPPAASAEPESEYRLALDALKAGRLQEARSALEGFL
ncbi:MAG: YbgF trimerization domain-containing protein, partial [Steroidobacteraceae bacterium]